MDMVRRRDATQKTLDDYRGVVFDWRTEHCVHLAHAHMVNMGHEPPEVPHVENAIEAKRALKDNGWSSVENMLDNLLPRWPGPAFMRLGDIALVEGAGGLDAIFICAGPMKVFGWREDKPDLVLLDITMDKLKGAWKV